MKEFFYNTFFNKKKKHLVGVFRIFINAGVFRFFLQTSGEDLFALNSYQHKIFVVFQKHITLGIL